VEDRYTLLRSTVQHITNGVYLGMTECMLRWKDESWSLVMVCTIWVYDERTIYDRSRILCFFNYAQTQTPRDLRDEYISPHHPLRWLRASPLLSFLFSRFFSPFLFLSLPTFSGSATASILRFTFLSSLLSLTPCLTRVRWAMYSVVPSFFCNKAMISWLVATRSL